MKSRAKLNKTLKPHWVWAIALGSAIGWGAFVQPIDWMKTAGPLGVVIGFSVGAILMMIIAVSYGFLIRKYPVSGGEFAYAYISLGRTHAFICGWFLTLGCISIVALNASAFALMFKYLLPILSEKVYLYSVAGWNIYLPEIIISTMCLMLFGYLNIKGASLTGRLQFIFTIIMVGGVLLLTFLIGIQPNASITNLQPSFPENKTAFAAILAIIAITPWAFVGFDIVPQAAEEFAFSAKKAFGLIIFALVFATGIYICMTIVTALSMPWEQVAQDNHLWGTAYVIQEGLGTTGLLILIVALSMGIFTGLNGFIMASSRILFAMSRAKVLPKSFEILHPKYKTPYVAVIFIISISAFAPWLGREALIWIVDMSSIGVSIAYLYTCITAYRLFIWSGQYKSVNIIQKLFLNKKTISLIGIIASSSFIGLLLIPGSPAFLGFESRIALLIWIVLGVSFYLFKRREYNSIPESELEYLILGRNIEKRKTN